jgi:superfamily I DNA/RNA helicase
MRGGDHLRGLNPEQNAAVRCIDGPLLVLAGAGTGKTRVVTCRIAEMLARGVPARTICALTFTNKAAREMRERVRGLLPRANLEGLVVSTFHSLGLRILREAAAAQGDAGPTILDPADQIDLVADLLREAGVRRDELPPRAAHAAISKWKNAARGPDEVGDGEGGRHHDALLHVYGRYEEELRRRRSCDFDDLILRPIRLLEEDAGRLGRLRDRWHRFLVDEYQDTNDAQYRLLLFLALPRGNLCVVGDDDQSIYGWRGADAARILAFTRDFPRARVVALERNYRSTSAILEVANALIAGNPGRHPKSLRAETGEGGPPVELYFAADEKDELDFVSAGLLRHHRREGRPFEDLAVLFRANRQCRPLEQALRARQIPYRVVGTSSFFDRREVRDLLAFVRLAANPKDDAAFLRIANVPARGLGRAALDRVFAAAAEGRLALVEALAPASQGLGAAARAGALELLRAVGDLRERAAEEGPGPALRELVASIRYEDHVRMTAEDPHELAVRLKVVEELLGMAQHAATRDLAAWAAELALDAVPGPEGDEDRRGGVTLLTLHAAKGLEFPVVYVVGVEETLLPHARAAGEGDDGDASLAVEEERRLFYVGITRARRHLHITCARQRTRFGRSEPRVHSRFLDEIGMARFLVTTPEAESPASAEQGRAWLQRIRASMRGGSEA